MEDNIDIDQIYMKRCIELARCAEGQTYPNPMVGSVIVHNGIIIGEGFHHKAGGPHAEVNAINSVKNKELLKESTIYVCLEPCAHYGRTPPCAQLIIDMKIPKVVIGCQDSFSEVAGKGIEMLRNAGINITCGILEQECRNLNKRFFTFHEKKRPYIILKWAESFDGFIDSDRSQNDNPIWLTNDHCKSLVHKQRATEQAILIGVGTANADNPSLTTRAWSGNNPIRIVIDPHLRTNSNANILTDGLKTIIFNSSKNLSDNFVTYFSINFETSPIEQMLNILHKNNIQSIIVEGGAFTLNKFIEENIWDEVYLYRSKIKLNKGVKAPALKKQPYSATLIDDVTLLNYQNI